MLKSRWALVLAVFLAIPCLADRVGASELQSAPAFSKVDTGARENSLEELLTEFIAEFKALNIPEFDYSYANNLKQIHDLDGINRQVEFFGRYKAKLRKVDRNSLSTELQFQYDALSYEIEFNIERTRLELEFKEKHANQPIPADGLFRLPESKRWYALYIRRWTSTEMTPDDIFNFGVAETTRALSEYKAIQEQLGYGGKDEAFYALLNGPLFQIADQGSLMNALTGARAKAQQNLGVLFDLTAIPPVEIQPIAQPTKDTPPGYYDAGVFYYNFFENRFPKRTLDWLYLHEAVPGHHYQTSVGEAGRAAISKLFWYPAYSEGWAAYIENMGKDLGFYQDPYQYLGKWEWDMVRSIRLALDVGINYKGWSKARALDFWKQHIPNQNSIAEREIDRIIRWPAQVMSYKIGERNFLQLKRYCEQHQGLRFDLRRFHSSVLRKGSIPLPVLNNILFKECDH